MSDRFANPSYAARRATYRMRLGMGSAVLAPRPFRSKAGAIERARDEVAGFIRRTEALRDAPAAPGCSDEAMAEHRRTCEAELADWRAIWASLHGHMVDAWGKGARADAARCVQAGRFYVEVRRFGPGAAA